MDSEPSSKPIESENAQATENLKENVPTVNVNEEKEKNTEKPADAAEAVVVEIVTVTDEKESEKPETVSEAQTTTTTTIVNTKTENDDDNSGVQTTTTTTTTVVTTKTKEDGEGETVETKTNETVVDTKEETKEEEVVQEEKAPVESTVTEAAESELESEESEEEEEDEEEELKEKEQVEEKQEKEQQEVKQKEEEKAEQGELIVEESQQKLKVENVEAIESKPEAAATQKENDVPLEKKAANVDINNQIENIISDIDISIRAQEKITQLKEQELQLIHKQKELANQIQKQQLLAQKLLAENQRKEQELREQEYLNRNQYREEYVPAKATQQDIYEAQESSNVSRTVDLRKIFTPATDAVEILPKNRKLYASSAFYSPTLHPTVEDQVELARRISHSLSDISNQTSKGQTMYVNRKKRSVKWVHEGCGQGEIDEIDSQALCKENAEESLSKELTKLDKLPLKLIMNPHGQMRDYNSLKESINIKTGLLSPENCAELITALQLHKGRGAELFAKRRRKADNWVVDETNAGTHSPSGLSDYQPYKPKPASSPNLLPAYSDAGKHRVQLNIHQENLIEKYAKPGIQVVKSPWEAALQTGSASSAFVNDNKYGNQTPIAGTASPLHLERSVVDYPESRSVQSDNTYGISSPLPNIAAQDIYKNDQFINPQRELAYKPSVAQGWGGRNVELPREYYLQDIHAYELQSNDDNGDGLYSSYANTNNTKASLTDNVIARKIDDEMQQRLRKLEEFQENFLKQQRLALADLAGLVLRAPSAEVEYINNKDVATSISSLPTTSKIIDEESLEHNAAAVNVRDLISSFEQQSLRDYEEYQKNQCKRTNRTTAKTDDKYGLVSEDSNLESYTDQLGLYVPKEISLASYAPPPAVAGGVNQSFSASSYAPPQAQNQSSYAPQQETPWVDYARGGGQPTQQTVGGGGGGFPVYNVSPGPYNAVPPKQQFNDPASYQKIPASGSQAGPQVNFNPSPLSFDKLSKFQEPNQQNARQQRYNKPSASGFGGGAVRNTVTAPFPAAGNDNRSSFYRSSPQDFGGNHQFNSQAQSFNNCARGWQTTPNSQRTPYSTRAAPPPSLASHSLPYSDF